MKMTQDHELRPLFYAILAIWDELTDHARVKTVETFRQRLKECIENKGGFTRF